MRTFSVTLASFILLAGCGRMTHDMQDHGEAAGKHAHNPITISDTELLPTVTLSVLKDSVAGWNAHIQATNFRFAPENASMAHIAGEGHAHLNVDGVKIARVYGEWFHIPSLEKGKRIVSVSLNANSHAPLFFQAKPIEASVMVDVQ